jgi:hypothetical protein
MKLWNKDYLDIIEPAHIPFKANGLGEFKFGCIARRIGSDFIDDDAKFISQDHDGMDEVSGSGWAELDDDSGEISFHLGDESSVKARRYYPDPRGIHSEDQRP